MQRDIDQINVIPLVDVMLVLLVIVLTTATFISSGQIPVNLAKAKEVGDSQRGAHRHHPDCRRRALSQRPRRSRRRAPGCTDCGTSRIVGRRAGG